MITETGKVVALNGEHAWVQTIRVSACESCSARSGCGQRALAAVSGGRANQILVENTAGARVGDEVVIGVDEQSLLSASLAVYGVPLVLMVLMSIAGHRWFGGTDLVAILGALVGLGTGFWLVRRWQSRSGEKFQPRMIRINRIAAVPCL
ncbi:SoxR reducing system RseC family protein [Marinobacter sp. SS5-14b]|uniref:SoxR reducing system RseC family protein n=1 Tax=Marinobacter sp. SS5-14b TaxID=3050456 RepID=UPI0026DF61EC|nr:SoxR reducing system RseC family protein [Marinobacter sp. SS5-14b]